MSNDDTFIGEFETMDLTELYDEIFLVACSTGDRNKPKFIPETIAGPFNFFEMVEAVGEFYRDQQLHAKALIPSKNIGQHPKVLDENTIDYIEANYVDIISDGLLGGELLSIAEYTCKAEFIKEQDNE